MKTKNSLNFPDNFQPINVSWHITFKCNYDCQFCFRPNFGQECSFEEAKKIIDKLAKAGLKKISWGGGEPLLWPRIFDLIKYTKSLGITTMIITNGELLNFEKIRKMEKVLDWLNLPLDGSCDKVQDLMTRKEGHFSRTMKVIDYINNNKLDIKLKINTVASKLNKDDIINIATIIKKEKIKRWKIFQFYPIRQTGAKNSKIFSIKESDFLRIKEEVLPLFENSKQMVVFETNQDMERSYFAIAPSGKVYVSHGEKDYIVGDLKVDSVEKIWQNKLIDKVKFWERSKWIFNASS